MIALLAFVGLLVQSDDWIVFEQDRQVFAVRPDGSDRRPLEEKVPSPHAVPSPDGKRRLSFEYFKILISDADGRNEQTVMGCDFGWPLGWSPDGTRVFFEAATGEGRSVWTATADGSDRRAVAAPPKGRIPGTTRLSPPATWIASQTIEPVERKLRPSDLTLISPDGKTVVDVVKGADLLDFAWSPDGSLLAYSLPGAIVVYDVAGRAIRKTIALPKELATHGAFAMTWRPDGRALACAIVFLGGRMAPLKSTGAEELDFPPLPGDREIFVVTMEGDVRTIETGARARPIRWSR